MFRKSALNAFSCNAEVLNSKNFGLLVPTMVEGPLCDTKTSNFQYRSYPQKISGYVTAILRQAEWEYKIDLSQKV